MKELGFFDVFCTNTAGDNSNAFGVYLSQISMFFEYGIEWVRTSFTLLLNTLIPLPFLYFLLSLWFNSLTYSLIYSFTCLMYKSCSQCLGKKVFHLNHKGKDKIVPCPTCKGDGYFLLDSQSNTDSSSNT